VRLLQKQRSSPFENKKRKYQEMVTMKRSEFLCFENTAPVATTLDEAKGQVRRQKMMLDRLWSAGVDMACMLEHYSRANFVGVLNAGEGGRAMDAGEMTEYWTQEMEESQIESDIALHANPLYHQLQGRAREYIKMVEKTPKE
jgi:hypothetical protein